MCVALLVYLALGLYLLDVLGNDEKNPLWLRLALSQSEAPRLTHSVLPVALPLVGI